MGSGLPSYTERNPGRRASWLAAIKEEAGGIEPALLWSRDFGHQNVTFIAKWLHEFHARNRLEGDHVFLSFVLEW